MSFHRLLAQLGTCSLVVSACAAENPNAADGAGGSSGGSASPTAGVTAVSGAAGASGATGTGGVVGSGGQIAMAGAVSSAGQSGTGGVVDTGGTAGRGGADAGGAGTAGSAGVGGAGGLPLKNPPVLSAGCGKATTVTSGSKTITSSGDQRNYIIDLPANYDMNKPYRYFWVSHGQGGKASDTQGRAYYELKTLAEAANDPAVFVAGSGAGGSWGEKDHAFFDDVLALVKQNVCIDTTRVFVTGFSFGAMYSYSLSLNHQKDIRAGVGMSPANYNIWLPPKTHEPIGWMQTTGMDDGTTPWDRGNNRGAKYIAIEHAADNGCTAANVPTWQSGKHLCYDYAGCKPGYPVKVCTFDGAHTREDSDPGSNTNWIAEESWAFFSQF